MVMKQNMGVLGGMNISMKSDVNVLSSGDNKFELSTQAKRVQMDMAQGGQEVKFDSIDLLKSQIKKDIEEAKKILN